MATFIQRNKKKSALAALLLFLRTRKTISVLLLLMILASILFVSPSNLILTFPGGARVAAGVAWIAGKIGMDTSKWGLAGGKRDYNDLVAAFRAAKTSGTPGWSAFLRGGAGGDGSNGVGGGTGSLDFVKGNRKDLESKTGSGEALAKPGTVQGVLNADDARDRGEGDAVAINPDDVGGEREGLVKSAFAGGFANGSSAFSGNGTGTGQATTVGSGFGSNGAYAGKGFFGGAGGAASGTVGDVVKGGLGNVGNAPKGTIKGGAQGRLSAASAAKVKTNITQGMLSVHTPCAGQKCAIAQLAAGNGRATLSVGNNCNADNNCPAEFAATNTGVIYDGGKISGDGTGILTGTGGLGHDEPTPTVPMDTDIPPQVDPTKIMECTNAVQACEKEKQPYYKQMSQNQTALNNIFNRMGGDCADQCHCDPCDRDKRDIHAICDGPLKQAIDKVNAPCNMPSYCAEMGIKPPGTRDAGASVDMCKMNTGSCGPDGFFGAFMCFLGS